MAFPFASLLKISAIRLQSPGPISHIGAASTCWHRSMWCISWHRQEEDSSALGVNSLVQAADLLAKGGGLVGTGGELVKWRRSH